MRFPWKIVRAGEAAQRSRPQSFSEGSSQRISYQEMDAFLQLLLGQETAISLDRAAVRVAEIELGVLEERSVLTELDRLAELVRREMLHGFRLAAERVLFERLGFGGNEDDYYNPRNSCLPWVLAERRGIPIALSVVYIEVARRLGIAVDGIAAPGHFVVRIEEAGDTYYLDPFRGGLIREDIEEEVEPHHLLPAKQRAIVIRMLNNLRQIYLARRSWAKAERTLDYLLSADPRDLDAFRQRSAARAGLRKFRLAAQDLERILELSPSHPEADEFKLQVTRLNRLHAGQN
jgi:regulator of sirC expression with transglutaminase-like and TPR domain